MSSGWFTFGGNYARAGEKYWQRVAKEFEWLENMYGLNELDAQILTSQALDAAFADDDIKETVWKNLKKLN